MCECLFFILKNKNALKSCVPWAYFVFQLQENFDHPKQFLGTCSTTFSINCRIHRLITYQVEGHNQCHGIANSKHIKVIGFNFLAVSSQEILDVFYTIHFCARNSKTFFFCALPCSGLTRITMAVYSSPKVESIFCD